MASLSMTSLHVDLNEAAKCVDLFGQLENILDFNVSDMNSKSLCNLLLFGKPDL